MTEKEEQKFLSWKVEGVVSEFQRECMNAARKKTESKGRRGRK